MAPPNFLDDERFDGLYLNIANQAQGIEPLLDTVFSFLRRKSDFFAGPPGSGQGGTDAAIAKVNEVLKKHADVYLADKRKKDEEVAKKEASKKKKREVEEAKKVAKSVEKAKVEDDIIELGDDGEFDISNSAPVNQKSEEKATTQPQSVEPDVTDAKDAVAPKTEEGDDAPEEDDSPPPIDNGGTIPGKYVWTQTLAELTVTVPLPENTRGRDLNVTISKKHLKVGLKGHPLIVDAPLRKIVVLDDSFWTVEDSNRLVLTLQKLNQMEWWDCVCEGDPTINIQKVVPENSNLNDLDGETRQTVEKMMFDQRQKALGLPTAEEQKKLDIMEKFKLAHPEMDFSNAKISWWSFVSKNAWYKSFFSLICCCCTIVYRTQYYIWKISQHW